MTADRIDELVKKLDAGLESPERLSDSEKDGLIAAFCRVKPPKIPKDEELRYHRFRIVYGGRRGGVSIKPGNIILNWRKLIGALPGIALTGAGAATSPWLIILGALVIWKDLYSTLRVELEQQHATAMLVMWKNHNGKQWISEEKARILTNEALADFDLNQVSESNFAKIIDDLSKAGCVELSDGQIWLRERIQRSWP